MNKQKMVFMFSGQGSQFPKMGLCLYKENSVFSEWMQKMDAHVQRQAGYSVLDRIYYSDERPEYWMNDLWYSHLAIFMCQYALAQTIIAHDVQPDIVLGASLGEYVALCVSGILDHLSAIDMLLKQVELIEANCEKGVMVTILDDIDIYKNSEVLNNYSTLVAENYTGNYVISMSEKNYSTVLEYLKKKSIRHIKLMVPYSFHSESMDVIKNDFLKSLRTTQLSDPLIEIASSSECAQISTSSYDHLWRVIRSQIGFSQFIREHMNSNLLFFDCGLNGTLGNIVSKLADESRININILPSIITPFGTQHKLQNIIRETKEAFIVNKVKGTAYLFPGQGSQQVGMGNDLFDEFSDFVQMADNVLGYSIEELCLNNPDNKLNNTKYTQPALYVVNCLSYLKQLRESQEEPSYMAGHSLGEYCALYAADVFDFETGLRLVKKRAELMSVVKDGGMAAVVGLKVEEIADVIEKNSFTTIDIGNLNTPTQIVLSGPKADIASAKDAFIQYGAKNYVELNVSGAFHSRYMESALDEFEPFINQFKYREPKIPVISNYTARPYKDDIAFNMVKQLTNPVQWTDTIRYLLGENVTELKQIGPGNVITGLVARIKREATPLIIDDVVRKPVPKSEAFDRSVLHDFQSSPKASLDETTGSQDSTKDCKIPAISKETKTDIDYSMESEVSGQDKLTDSRPEFCEKYNLIYPIIVGSMDHGISGVSLVVGAAKAHSMAFLSSVGVTTKQLEKNINSAKAQLDKTCMLGVNVTCNIGNSKEENGLIDLLIRNEIDVIEASSYFTVTPSLAKYKILGLTVDEKGNVLSNNKVIAKVGRYDVAQLFLSPVPNDIIEQLITEGEITEEQSVMAQKVSLADDLCVIGDQAGPTDVSNLFALLPAIKAFIDTNKKTMPWLEDVHIGAAGGIGTSVALEAALKLGADFAMVGSVALCTQESGICDACKKLLSEIQISDTQLIPSFGLFEQGSYQRVVRKSVFFPARANHLYELYRNYGSVAHLSDAEVEKLEKRYFKRSINSILDECFANKSREELDSLKINSKHELSLIYQWYVEKAIKSAITGEQEEHLNYCMKCSSALGAFNECAKGSPLELWENRTISNVIQFISQNQ